MSFETRDFTFQTPFTMLLVGKTQSGKTSFVKQLLDRSESMFDTHSGSVYYFYHSWQPAYEQINATFIQGMCTTKWVEENIGSNVKSATIVIDDLASEITSDTARLFTVISHHKNINIVVMVHSLFMNDSAYRLMSYNSKYIVIFKNVRDASTIVNFAKQFDPHNSKRLVEIYREATKDSYSYLLFDLSSIQEDDYRLRSNIFFENDKPMRVFVRS